MVGLRGRRREEGVDAETGEVIGIVTTAPAQPPPDGKSLLSEIIKVKTEAAEESEEAHTLHQQQALFTDFLQAKIDELKAIAVEAGADRARVSAIVERKWRCA